MPITAFGPHTVRFFSKTGEGQPIAEIPFFYLPLGRIAVGLFFAVGLVAVLVPRFRRSVKTHLSLLSLFLPAIIGCVLLCFVGRTAGGVMLVDVVLYVVAAQCFGMSSFLMTSRILGGKRKWLLCLISITANAVFSAGLSPMMDEYSWGKFVRDSLISLLWSLPSLPLLFLRWPWRRWYLLLGALALSSVFVAGCFTGIGLAYEGAFPRIVEIAAMIFLGQLPYNLLFFLYATFNRRGVFHIKLPS